MLQHLGVKPGDKIELQLLPGSKGVLQAERKKGSISDLAGFLKGKTNGARLTIEEINDAIAEAATAEVMESLNR